MNNIAAEEERLLEYCPFRDRWDFAFHYMSEKFKDEPKPVYRREIVEEWVLSFHWVLSN